MTLYERTVETIELEQAEETLRLKRETETRRIADSLALITRVGEMIAADEKTLAILRPTLTFTEDGYATVTIDEEFTFTLLPRQQCEVTMLASICTAGCHAIIANREEFLAFFALHLTLGHTPVPPDPEPEPEPEVKTAVSAPEKRGAS